LPNSKSYRQDTMAANICSCYTNWLCLLFLLPSSPITLNYSLYEILKSIPDTLYKILHGFFLGHSHVEWLLTWSFIVISAPNCKYNLTQLILFCCTEQYSPVYSCATWDIISLCIELLKFFITLFIYYHCMFTYSLIISFKIFTTLEHISIITLMVYTIYINH